MLGALTALVAAIVTGGAACPILRRLPEPVEAVGKIAYDSLATTRFAVVCGLLAAAGVTLTYSRLPTLVQPLWWVLASAGVLLAAVDGATTWIPTRLIHGAWGLMVLAAAGTVTVGGDGAMLLRTAVGAASAGLLYGAAWAISRGGFGFGDVRFAPLIGAAAAAHSGTLLVLALLLGTLLGAGHGVVRLIRRRPGGFPYAPSMLAGAYVACLLVPAANT